MVGYNPIKRTASNILIGILVIPFLFYAEITNLSAQNPYTKFEHLTIDDGLSSNRIRCIFRDSRDYLWIGTDAGLNRYDSYQIIKYKSDTETTGSISSDNATCIFEDHGKNLWFGTDNGLNLYDRSKDRFIVFKNNPADSNSINNNYISSIIEDKNENLWIVTDGNCLNKWNPETGKFIRYHYPSSTRIAYTLASRMIASDSKGYFWVVSFGKNLYRFDPETGAFIELSNPSIDLGEHCYKSLYIDSDDKIWITSTGNGFFSYDPLSGRYEKFSKNDNGFGPNQSIILDVLPEDDSHLLLAVDHGGLNRFDKVSGKFEYMKYNPEDSEGLNNDGIWCLYKDKEGILWIGTSGGGINFYNPQMERFKVFRHNDKNAKSLSYNATICFLKDSRGLVWIGTEGGGVNVYDPSTGIFKVYKHNPADPYSIAGNTIRKIAEDNEGDIWIGTWDGGLIRFDRKTSRFYNIVFDELNHQNIAVLNLFIDYKNIIWVCVLNEGIIRYDKNKGVINRFKSDPDNPEAVSDDQGMFFYEDHENNMWICTPKGLNRYVEKDNHFKVLKFPENDIWAFHRENEGNIWVGTSSVGVYYCNPDGKIIETFSTSNGLPDNSIRAITGDNAGNIWISTNNGISRLDVKSRKIRNYSKSDGLQSDHFLQQSFLKTAEGELYFGGTDGFNSFFPENIKENDYVPQVHITDFQIFNKPIEYGAAGSQFPTHISEAEEITLTWRQVVFSFSFAAINYTSPEKSRYAYKMEGFDKDWNYTDAARRYVMYTNLSPGNYAFKVKASNNDGIWNDEGRTLRIVILPPWWQKLWFNILVIITVLVILASFYLSRVRRLKRQKVLLENLVARKTSELKEQNKVLEEHQSEIETQKEDLYQLNASKDKFFSIIAHDLRNPFNSIIGLSQVLKEEISKGNYSRGEEFAGLLNATAEKTFRLLENLLEWANIQRGKIAFYPEEINLSEIINEEIILLSDLAKSKNIELLISVPENLVFTADRNMIKTILRNLITNALKFTHRNGKVHVNAAISYESIGINVSDNGIGMTKDMISDLFRIDVNHITRGTENEEGTGLGLFLCKEFVEKHDGKIWVESEIGKGSTFNFLIPLRVK